MSKAYWPGDLQQTIDIKMFLDMQREFIEGIFHPLAKVIATPGDTKSPQKGCPIRIGIEKPMQITAAYLAVG